MTNLDMWAQLVGFFLPVVVAFVMRPTFPKALRSTLSVAISVAVAFVTVWLQGDFSWDSNLVGSIFTVLIAAQASYLAFWKPSKVAPIIELKTSPDSPEKTKALAKLKAA